MTQRLMIVEDDTPLREGLCETFADLGYDISSCARGDQVVAAVEEGKPDLLLLDLMLPGAHGRDICRELRKRGRGLPVIMLTALADETQIVEGLKAGADDYVTKPFRLNELVARVEAQLRRAASGVTEHVELPACRLDLTLGVIDRAGAVTPLTHLELELLKYLLRARPSPVSRAALLTDVWGYKDAIETRTVDVAIGKLRTKIEENAGEPRVILTVRERGYRIVLPGDRDV